MTTEENPYAPPKTSDWAVGVRSGRREDLRTVALAQKAIIVCILLNISAVLCIFLLPREWLALVVAGVLVLIVAQMVSVVTLAIKVYNVGTGIIYGIGTMVPYIGLILLLVINNKATKVLRENGHHVGFFGADLSEFRRS
jgi:hypothetical protein